MTRGIYRIFLAVLILLVAGGVFVLPMLGRTMIPPDFSERFLLPFGSQIYRIRFQRTLLAAMTGGGLALAGLVFQAMFRNPLATPYTLGVAAGASFGAALTLRFGFPLAVGSFLGLPCVSWGALGGALLTTGIVFVLARNKDASSEQMLLAGVAINFFFSGLIVLLQYVSAPHDAMQILRWTMGGVQNAAAGDLGRIGPVVLTALTLLMFFSRELNVIVTGTERARSLGIDVAKFRSTAFVAVSLMIGVIVAVTGPIGFVGLMVPHISRMIVGPNHQRLVPATFLGGAGFLAVCDTLGRCLFHPAELPVGILTGLLGGPFFLWLLLRSEKRLG